MKTNKIILFILCFYFSEELGSQNLVPNPDFETYKECPDTSFLGFYQILDSTWREFNSADYFNSCDTSSNFYGIPSNFIGGYQFAHSGNAYVGLLAYNSGMFNREYIEIELLSQLIGGQTYYVRYYISLADDYQYAVENMGAMFTDTLFNPFPPPSFSWITGVPQVENTTGVSLNDKVNWVAVSGSFVALGGEKFLSIGNFRNDINTVSQYLGSASGFYSATYYYIDDVYVGTTPPPVSVQENEQDTYNIKLYPNPNNGVMTLECNLLDTENGKLTIYDITGKFIRTYTLANGTKQLTVDAQLLEAGIYLYDVIVDGKKIEINKFAIIK
ncbi:MAG: T9SS type A sorting domain-containing protein [Bacteroidetes bacterium]|nr:T9SS type A sorting domain-containing protein [Bacteroidota bacterium]